MTTNIHDIRAVGLIAQDCFATVAVVERMAGKLGIMPALRINGIDHFEAKDAKKIADAIREKHREPGSNRQSKKGGA